MENATVGVRNTTLFLYRLIQGETTGPKKNIGIFVNYFRIVDDNDRLSSRWEGQISASRTAIGIQTRATVQKKTVLEKSADADFP